MKMNNVIKKISFLTVLGLMMSSLVFASGTTNIKVILPTSGGPYSIYKQTCSGWKTNNTSCNKWDLSTVQANSDGRYPIKTEADHYETSSRNRNDVFYFLALSSDATKTFGASRFGTAFANQTTWAFSADGKTDAINDTPNQDYVGKTLSGDLTGKDFSNQQLTTTELASANLTNANFSGADLTGVNLNGTLLAGANLTNANLTNAKLWAADLHGANITNANFSGADVTHANLAGVIGTANLTPEQLATINQPNPNPVHVKATFYNQAGQSIAIQPLVNGIPYGQRITIPYTATVPLASDSVDVMALPSNKITYTVSIPGHTDGLAVYDITKNPFGYRINADSTTVIITDLSSNPYPQEQSPHATNIYRNFYNQAGQSMTIQPLVNGIPYGQPILIPYTATVPLASDSIDVMALPSNKITYTVSIPGHTDGLAVYDTTKNPFGYRINADSTTVIITDLSSPQELTVPEPGAKFMIHVINIPKGYGVSDTNPTTKESGRGSSKSGSMPIEIKQNENYYISDANDGAHSKQHPASDFTGKTTWDATTDIIS